MKNPGQRWPILLSAVVVAALIPCLEARAAAKFFFPNPTEAAKCWHSVEGIPSCVADGFSSFLGFRIQLGPECCAAIRGIGDHCFHSITSHLPFNPFFPPLTRGFCPPPPPNPSPVRHPSPGSVQPEPIPTGGTASPPASDSLPVADPPNTSGPPTKQDSGDEGIGEAPRSHDGAAAEPTAGDGVAGPTPSLGVPSGSNDGAAAGPTAGDGEVRPTPRAGGPSSSDDDGDAAGPTSGVEGESPSSD